MPDNQRQCDRCGKFLIKGVSTLWCDACLNLPLCTHCDEPVEDHQQECEPDTMTDFEKGVKERRATLLQR